MKNEGLFYGSYEWIVFCYYKDVLNMNLTDFAKEIITSGLENNFELKLVVNKLSKGAISNYRNSDRGFHEPTARYYKDNPTARELVAKFFDSVKMQKIGNPRKNDLVTDILQLIDDDESIIDANKTYFANIITVSSSGTLKNFGGFMAEVFVYAITKDLDRETSIRKPKPILVDPTLPPYGRNKNFVGRENIFRQIHEHFDRNATATLSQTISGLGGVGKTATALEYVYRHLRDYSLVKWVDAESEESLYRSILPFVVEMGLQKEGENNTLIIDKFRGWFEKNNGWLLIFDNVDNFDAISTYIPKVGSGNILFTTRLSKGYDGDKIDISCLGEQEAVKLLLNITMLDDKEGAAKLAERLGCLPLALEQAGAYIVDMVRPDFVKYISYLDEKGLAMFESDETSAGDKYKATVRTTWNISMEKVKDKSAEQFLEVLSYLAPTNILLHYFTKPSASSPPVSRDDVDLEPLISDIRDEDKFNRILQRLTKFSLVKHDKETGCLSIHRLLQDVIREKTKFTGELFRFLKAHFYFMDIYAHMDVLTLHKTRTHGFYYDTNRRACPHEHMRTIGRHIAEMPYDTEIGIDPTDIVEYHMSIGKFYKTYNSYEKNNSGYAVEAFKNALKIFEQSEEMIDERLFSYNLSVIYAHIGFALELQRKFHEAIDYRTKQRILLLKVVDYIQTANRKELWSEDISDECIKEIEQGYISMIKRVESEIEHLKARDEKSKLKGKSE